MNSRAYSKNLLMLVPVMALIIFSMTIMPAFAASPNTSDNAAVPPTSGSLGAPPVFGGEGASITATTAPYVAAYHDTSPHFGVKKVKVTCNFSGTDRTKIQSDNYLTCIESLQSPTNVAGLDYGYQAYVTLKQTGSIIVGADVWKACETLPNSCDPDGTVTNVSTKQLAISATTSDDITIFIEWNSAGTIATWYYQVGSGSKTSYHTFTKPSEDYAQFNTGKYQVLLDRYAYYFQAGIASKYNIGQSGWYVYVKNPSYSTTVGGSYISYYTPARSIEGDRSWWDRDFKWGGAAYTGVNADYYCKTSPPPISAGQVKFYYNSATLGSDVILWGLC